MVKRFKVRGFYSLQIEEIFKRKIIDNEKGDDKIIKVFCTIEIFLINHLTRRFPVFFSLLHHASLTGGIPTYVKKNE